MESNYKLKEVTISESRSHKTTANRLAKMHGAEYNQGEGPDIETPLAVMEIETEDTVSDAARQLQGYKKPVYVVGANERTVQKAMEFYKDKTIGVMDNQGNIRKSSSRG